MRRNLKNCKKEFISKYLFNISLLITFTIMILSIIVIGVILGYKVNLIPTIMCCSLIIVGWIHLFRYWRKWNLKG